MSADVLIHVQHLLGIGHLKRAARIAGGCAQRGLDTVVASGGLPVPDLELGGARLHQLPAARAADLDFSGLLDADGRPVDDAWKARRRAAALDLLARERPRVLVLELFPFGRRSLRFELLPLLEAAAALRPRPWILVSLRDLLNPPTPEKARWAVETAERVADRILVHGDPAVARLEETFPDAERVRGRLVYTGYVAEPVPQDVPASGEVLVSTGGGAVGGALARAAVAARGRSRRAAEAPWRVLLGGNLPEAEYLAIAEQADAGTVVERNRPDFLRLLAGCRVSVSQAGYNTVMEVLSAGVPGVVVPFAAGGREGEQPLRARRLAARGLIDWVPEDGLTPTRLANAVDRALARAGAGAEGECAADPQRKRHTPDLDGVRNSAETIRQLAAIVAPATAGRTTG